MASSNRFINELRGRVTLLKVPLVGAEQIRSCGRSSAKLGAGHRSEPIRAKRAAPARPPPHRDPDAESFRPFVKKAISLVPKVNRASSSKRMRTDVGLFSSFLWIEPESAQPPPGNLFSARY